MKAWAGLQEAALRDVHPGWLPGLAAELVTAARSRRAGRRQLARHLAADFRLIARAPGEWGSDDVLAERQWVFEPAGAGSRALRLVGALRALPWIRAQVSRQRVLTMERVMGRPVYRALLAHECSWSLPEDDTRRIAFAVDERDPTPETPDLEQILEQWGSRELTAYGRAIHEALGERFMLAANRDAVASGVRAIVPAESIDGFLARVSQGEAQ